MEMDMDSIFREYGMDGIEAQLGELFPTLQIDLETLLKQAFTGDIKADDLRQCDNGPCILKKYVSAPVADGYRGGAYFPFYPYF